MTVTTVVRVDGDPVRTGRIDRVDRRHGHRSESYSGAFEYPAKERLNRHRGTPGVESVGHYLRTPLDVPKSPPDLQEVRVGGSPSPGGWSC